MPDSIAVTARVLELFPLLIDLEPEAREQRLAEETRLVQTRLRQMLELEPVGFTEQALGAVHRRSHPPEEIDGFRLLHLLGEGGEGQVYLAEQACPRRRVAIKLLECLDDAARARFDAQVQSLARFGGNGCPFLIQAGVTGPWAWLAMEWVQGPHLDTWASDQPRARRREVLLALCTIVARAHRAGMVHLDLKPSNLLVSGDRVVLLDLGIAQVCGTRGRGAGTPGWRSPEQVDGGVVDARSDVYALGRLAEQLAADEPRWCEPIARAVAHDPAARPADAAAFAEELKTALQRAPSVGPSSAPLLERVRRELPVLGGLEDLVDRARVEGGDLRTVASQLATSLDQGVLSGQPEAELRVRLALAEALVDLEHFELGARQAEAAHALIVHTRDAALIARVHLEMAEAHRTRHAYEQALASLQLARDALPDDSPLHARRAFVRGRIAMNTRDADRAIACFEEALALDPESWNARLMLVYSLTMAGRFPEAYAALAELEHAASGALERGRALGAASTLHFASGAPDEALSCAERGLHQLTHALGPGALETARSAARMAAVLKSRDPARAVALLHRTLEHLESPAYRAVVVQSLMGVHLATNDPRAAIDVAQPVFEALEPGHRCWAPLGAMLARAWRMQGDLVEARRVLAVVMPTFRAWRVGGEVSSSVDQIEALAEELGL
jgi:tetratricopeptide (TPR) repeat protein/predicted Ser/Thr protein kinase